MKILITGGNGMVGRNIRQYHLAAEYEILAPSSKELDLLDYASLDHYIAENKPDFVIHCAGRVGGIMANMHAQFDFLYENLEMGKNLVLALKNNNVKKMLNLASSCMYPRNAVNPLKESALLTGELEPTNEGYAIAKIATWKLCQHLSKPETGFEFKTIIPCNLYGPYDKFDAHKAHLIPAIIRKVHEAKKQSASSIDVWGSGNARREFMYVDDLANAVFFCLKNFEKLPLVFNCGTGVDFSINDYYSTTAKVLGWQGEYQHDLSKPEGMMQKLTDVTILSQIGWKAQVSLEEGISKTYQYFKEAHI